MKDQKTDKTIQIGKLADDLHINPFTVPENYFRGISHAIHLKKRLNDDMKASFEVPEQYFDKAKQEIISSVRTETIIQQVSGSGFDVPAGYFQDLTNQIMNTVKSERESSIPVKTITKPARTTWWKYASAACITIGIGISAFFGLNRTPATLSTLDRIPEQEILGYLELYGEPENMMYYTEMMEKDTDIQLDGIGESEIEMYLNNIL